MLTKLTEMFMSVSTLTVPSYSEKGSDSLQKIYSCCCSALKKLGEAFVSSDTKMNRSTAKKESIDLSYLPALGMPPVFSDMPPIYSDMPPLYSDMPPGFGNLPFRMSPRSPYSDMPPVNSSMPPVLGMPPMYSDMPPINSNLSTLESIPPIIQ